MSVERPPMLRLHLLGGFRVHRDGGPPLAERWPRPSARTLLKLLAVSPDHRLHREEAMEICWPDADPHAALGSLRVALHAARRAVEPELAPRAASSYLIGEGAMLRLDPDTVWIDADEAEGLAEAALAHGDRVELAVALDAFTGELLPEDRYAPWSRARRERLAALREKTLLALAAAHLAAGATEEAVETAEQVLAASPAEEYAHRILMEAFIRQGLRRRAVHQYHLCREALDAEIGVRPGPETEALHRRALAAPTTAALSPRPALPAALRVPPSSPLRGRDDVLAELLGADTTPVLLVTGEAGLGKTRLVAEAARRAAEKGAVVLWGAGHDAEGQRPYGPFAEALEGWLADRSVEEWARTGAEYPELATLLPGRVEPKSWRSPEEERDRLFRASAALLGELAEQRPVLMVLDDLHAADAGSFQLLSHLARRARESGTGWRFLATLRPEELPGSDPRRHALEMLVRQSLARAVQPPRLPRQACLELAADALGSPAAAVPQRVWELSLGNPLFALELARALRDGVAGDSAAPEGVRQLVAQRLGRLDPTARRVVDVVAVAGQDAALVEVLDVARRCGQRQLSTAEATEAVEAAVAASVLEERPVAVEGRPMAGLAFRHPLVRMTCYEMLSAARRRLLHSAYAEAVLRRRPDAVDTLAAQLTRADDPRATGYLRRAAERAAAHYANDTADRYYAELTGRLDALVAESARARMDHSAVLRRMGRFEDAARLLREALAEMERCGDRDGRVLAAARLAELMAKTRSTDEGLRLLDACPPAPDTPAATASTHHLARAVLCFVAGRYEEGAAAARAAETAAQAVEGPERRGLLARALAMRATSLGLAGRFGETGPVAERALPHAKAYGDPQILTLVLSVLRETALRAGRLREAIETGRQALDLAERSGDPTATVFERANLARLHLLMEETAEARDLAETAVRETRPGLDWCVPYAQAALARVRIRMGEPGAGALLDEAERAARAQGDIQAQHGVRSVRAELELQEGRPEEALALLADPTMRPADLTARAWLACGRVKEAVEAAAAEVERAERAGERLAETDARTVHAAALAELGRERDAAEAFRRAAALAESLPYPAGSRRLALARHRCAAAPH
ncbi:AAA family ATPase [Streptomyces sp. NBC_01619]|uniref:ATP-binding protein n=1 Tax=Streptomyces sp. NBC_01619 TaxID=2975901 RepID=UPI002254B3EF|nr:AAA family ATPase [Streptomyces sp. NBC_01619]MCX4514592.1 AAA family ATPase [Streptomyces sp. NBC_01619]